MFELKNIHKEYKVDESKFVALKGIDLKFNESEFVSIVGPSGCGKTTLLNIIGGLDKPTNGEIIINSKNTKNFKDADWDAYRNNKIGFVFQSYNLIPHISVLKNVEMVLTLSGVPAKERKERATKALKEVGLLEHVNKRPNQLSGGQKQRVAIARALVNNPQIILADEPTGALDSKSSVQVMEILKKISASKLVIMVTHNLDLAQEYSNRIISMLDGKVKNDNKNQLEKTIPNTKVAREKRTKMSYWSAFKLSLSNLRTKKGRAIITSIASSIGIIGVALVLFLSNGFNNIIHKYERDVFSTMPITVAEYSMLNYDDMDANTMFGKGKNEFPTDGLIYPSSSKSDSEMYRKNNITKEYIDYVKAMDSSNYSMLNFSYDVQAIALAKRGDNFYYNRTSNDKTFTNLPDSAEYVSNNYDVLTGKLPSNDHEIVLMVDSKNRLRQSVYDFLNVDSSAEGTNVSQFVGKEISLANLNDYFIEYNGLFAANPNQSYVYENGTKLTIVGVIRKNQNEFNLVNNNSAIVLTTNLIENYLKQSMTSNVVVAQKVADYSVLTGKPFKPESADESSGTDSSITEELTKSQLLKSLGAYDLPTGFSVCPKGYDEKHAITTYLKAYNVGKDDADQVYFTDLASSAVSSITTMTNMMSIVLIVFASISLVVSTVMISIITYISVIERTKEIGVLKSLGARKKDITRVFKAESSLIGLFAGFIGIVFSCILCWPINALLSGLMPALNNAMQPSVLYAGLLIVISVVLTYISALIPSRIASHKDAVESLRTE